MFLALFVHALLVLALTWGVRWQDQAQDLSVEAELWSSIPQPVAAKGEDLQSLAEEVKPTPVPEPTPEPEPEPPPPPPAPVEPPKPSAQAQIAIDKQKQKEAKDKALQEAKAKREAKLKEAQDKKAEKAKQLAQQKAEQAQKAEQRHQEEVKRLRGLADATGAPADTGKAVNAAAPSASYLGKLRAKVKPNIVFSDTQLLNVVGNPAAEVEVTCSPSGQIIGAKLTVSSGNAAWDQAVLNAVEKTGSLPRDENGNVPNKIAFLFRPRD
jgi:colicin import membrane protein